MDNTQNQVPGVPQSDPNAVPGAQTPLPAEPVAPVSEPQAPAEPVVPAEPVAPGAPVEPAVPDQTPPAGGVDNGGTQGVA